MWKSNFLSFQISSFSDLDIDLLILNALFDIATANWSFVCYVPTSDYLIILYPQKMFQNMESPFFHILSSLFYDLDFHIELSNIFIHIIMNLSADMWSLFFIYVSKYCSKAWENAVFHIFNLIL